MQEPLHMTQALRRMPPSPAAIDSIMLNESANPPFYPSTPEYTAFFIAEKNGCTALNEKLLAASALSAPLRRQSLAIQRKAHKQGVFTTLILPNRENPGETLIVKIRRNASVGAGFGTFGGIVEDNEAASGFSMPLLRECLEEASEILGKGTAGELIDIIMRGRTIPLFKCRDDAHVIERGWGWLVDANAHASIVTDPDDQKRIVGMLQQMNVTKDKHANADHAETDGIAIFSLDRAPRALARQIGKQNGPQNIPAHHYGHEALGEISAVEKAFKLLNIDYAVRWHYFRTPGILSFIAPKMGIERKAVLRLLDSVLDAPMNTQVSVPDSAYGKRGAIKPIASAFVTPAVSG